MRVLCVTLGVVDMLLGCMSLGVGCMLVVERKTLGGEGLEKVCTTE